MEQNRMAQGAAAQSVFVRNEKKYLLNARQVAVVRQALAAAEMFPDQYGRHTICSLYFDTMDDKALRDAKDKAAFRRKLRLRSYGVPQDGDTVYLELKNKLRGTTYKRRTPMALYEAKAYLQSGIRPQAAGQVWGEVDAFMRQHRQLPKVVLCYDRVAYAAEADPFLRVTLDADIRWRATGLDLALGDAGHRLTGRDTWLMEVKTAGALPFWLARALSQAGVVPAAFSKYENARLAMGAAQGEVMSHVG